MKFLKKKEKVLTAFSDLSNNINQCYLLSSIVTSDMFFTEKAIQVVLRTLSHANVFSCLYAQLGIAIYQNAFCGKVT